MEEERFYEVALKEFPIQCLPEELRRFVEEVSANVQVSPDMVAVPMLSCLSAALQNRFLVRIDSTYTEPLCLYTLTIARPSERKSAVMNLLEKPFWEYQTKTNETLKAIGQKPVTLYVTDATPEKLARLMEENHGAIALFSDEPDTLAVAAGLRYGKSRNLGLMLQAWSAGHIMIQRATDDKRISIDRAVMCISVMSQPSFVEMLMKDSEMINRGFMQRFLYSLPLSRVGSRSFVKPEISDAALNAYNIRVAEFLDLDADRLREISLNKDAKDVAEWYFGEVETNIRETPAIEGWMGKLFGQYLRIAGILHCAKHWNKAAQVPIDGPTMAAAAGIAGYFVNHAKAVFTDIDVTQEIKDARELYRRMFNSGKEFFTKSDLYELTGRHIKKARLEAALVKLMNAQYVALFSENQTDSEKQVFMIIGDKRPPDEADLLGSAE